VSLLSLAKQAQEFAQSGAPLPPLVTTMGLSSAISTRPAASLAVTATIRPATSVAASITTSIADSFVGG